MKKLLFIISILIFLILIIYGEYIIKYDEGKLDEQRIRLIPDSVFYHANGEFLVHLSKENLGKEIQYFYGSGFIQFKADISTLNFEFQGENSDLIIWRQSNSSGFYAGGMGIPVSPGKIEDWPFDFNWYFDLTSVGQSVIKCFPVYRVVGTLVKNIEDSCGTGINIGKLRPTSFRLFVNMESSITRVPIRLEPEKWNLNWFNASPNKGVFTVWLNEGDLPAGLTLEDIETDTILFNGVLKPESVKIHNEGKKKFLMMKFSKHEAIRYIGYIEKGDTKTVNISGKFNDDRWFVGEKEITIVGKPEDNRYQKREEDGGGER